MATTHIAGIRWIGMTVADIDRSVAFYRDLLGIDMEAHPNYASGRLGDIGFVFELPFDDRGVTPGTQEFMFHAPDLERTATTLREAGHDVSDIRHSKQGDWFKAVDPDGYHLHFIRDAQ